MTDEGAGTDAGGEDPPQEDADADGEAADAEDVDPTELAAELDRLRERVDDLAAEGADRDDVADLRAELADLEDDVEERIVHRDEIERDLKRYVRKRVRRGKARGWGPYLVLLYGTAMTLGVFYFFQNSAGYATLAMVIIWLSTLGLYALMLLVNGALSLLAVPGKARDLLGTLRSLKP
jgi:membrane protein